MKRRDGLFLIICVVILITLIFLRPSYGWRVKGFLTPQDTLSDPEDPSLAAQNQALKAELAKLQSVAEQLPKANQNYIRAMVYSRYPFNFKSEILTSAGSGEGVAAGKAVVFQGVLVGVVKDVFSDSSLVQTPFDSNFKLPVRIGPHGYDALLVGGAYPMASSIKKDAALQAGDIIYSAAPGFQYGLPIAAVNTTSTSPDNLFEEASLKFAYDINEIQTVLIAK